MPRTCLSCRVDAVRELPGSSAGTRDYISRQISDAPPDVSNLLASSVKVSRSQLRAMTILASLTQSALMRTFTFTGVTWPIHLDPTPLFETISHPFRIRTVQARFPQSVASLTALIVYLCVVSCSRVHAYRYRDPPARPSVGIACVITAYKSTHDVGVVVLGATPGIVMFVEVEMEIVFFEQA